MCVETADKPVASLAALASVQDTLISMAPKRGPQARQAVERVQFRMALLMSTGLCYYRMVSMRIVSR